MKRLFFLLVLSLASVAASAQTWPQKPVRIVLPNAPGSTPDIVTRAFVEAMGPATGQPWIVENRPGGQGIVGAMAAINAPADGYTFLMAGTEQLALTPLMVKSVPYDPARDLALAAVVIDTNGFALAVPASSKANSVRELVALARSQPGKLTYATSVSLGELLGLWLQKEALVQMTEVRYKDIAVGIQDAIANRVDLVINSYPGLDPHVKGGRLKLIGVSTAERMPGLDSVPTVAETFPGVVVGGFLVLTAPANTPREVIERANRETNAVLTRPEFRQRVFRYGWHNVHGPRSVAETAEFVRANFTRFKNALEATGYQAK